MPFDCKPRYSGLFSENISPNTVHYGLCRRLCIKFLVVVFVVDIISDAYELSTIIATGKEYHCNSENFGRGDSLQIWGFRFEDEFVDPDGNRSH